MISGVLFWFCDMRGRIGRPFCAKRVIPVLFSKMQSREYMYNLFWNNFAYGKEEWGSPKAKTHKAKALGVMSLHCIDTWLAWVYTLLMNTTLQIRIDKKTKDQAQKTFNAMGLDMSSGVKLYLAQVVNRQAIPFPVISADYLPAKQKQQLMKDANYALKHGTRYASIEEAHRRVLGKK